MIRIFYIAQKDIVQLLRDRKTFLFLLIMPVTFTLLFGYAFGGFSNNTSDARLPVGLLDQDSSRLSNKLRELLSASEVIRLDAISTREVADLEQLVAENKLAAAIVVPPGYSRAMLAGKPARLTLIADTSVSAGMTIQTEVAAIANRLDSAAQTATIMERVIGKRAPFEYALERALSAWKNPPIAVEETTSSLLSSEKQNNGNASLAHSSPGMMLQFAIAGLLTAAQVIVTERKTRALQRLLTTATRHVHILLGHYAAIFALILVQFLVLISFGWLVLRVNYMREPGAILLVACSAALCIAALGLLIGVLAQSEEQAAIFSLVPMFVLSGLGGAWVPLEVTDATFQMIGHLSPVAWAMDGFKNISIRGLGIESVWLPASALIGYAVLFFFLAAWRFRTSEEH
ncbi:Linearmycin resistance permease protein LnrM [Anaerolineae bacterium]|nr:Linearmycin resistance permease protein LnrM [Anaerolineae bacterium]